MTPTGTNLLGLVKHLAYVELGYLGAVFGRPVPEAQPWIDDDGAPNWDMWATAARKDVTLHQVLVHVIAETHRHAGHADIVRELIDGAAGLRIGNGNLPPADREWWGDHRERVERAAREAAGG